MTSTPPWRWVRDLLDHEPELADELRGLSPEAQRDRIAGVWREYARLKRVEAMTAGLVQAAVLADDDDVWFLDSAERQEVRRGRLDGANVLALEMAFGVRWAGHSGYRQPVAPLVQPIRRASPWGFDHGGRDRGSADGPDAADAIRRDIDGSIGRHARRVLAADVRMRDGLPSPTGAEFAAAEVVRLEQRLEWDRPAPPVTWSALRRWAALVGRLRDARVRLARHMAAENGSTWH